MSQIHILAEHLANQIAAGEVVERPASVVKELVENALDAGATQIMVQVAGAGTRLLRVIDNGCGMEPDDALLCLERHATSKLRSADDLVNIRTLGFRGEAIPSIASVSRLTITSRPAGAALGCQVVVRFGSVLKVHEMGCASGTVLEVADLFANVPARRKFLRSAAVELAHIDEVLRSYALVSCQTGFRYQVDERDLLDLPAGESSVERRVRQVLFPPPEPGRQGGEIELIALNSDDAAARAEIEVHGFLLPPGQGSGRSGRLWTFVNGRYVKDRMLNHAVTEGMQSFLMKGARAAGVLFVRLPAEGVDVNVHPTKQEVRFREGNLIHNKVVAAVWAAMEGYQGRVKGQIFGLSQPKEVGLPPPSPPPWPQGGGDGGGELREPRPQALPVQGLPPRGDQAVDHPPSPPAGPVSRPVAVAGEVLPEGRQAPGNPPSPAPPRYMGQLFDTYLLYQIDDGLLAIDQHAVQERLLFEELKAHYQAQTMPSQRLLFPEMVELNAIELQALAASRLELPRLGLELGDFGGDTVIIQAVPAGLGHLPPAEILRGILSRFAEGQSAGQGETALDDILAGMACKAAIKAGQALTPQEANHLLARTREAGIFSHCPHGRPVYKRFSRYDIEKWFQRV